MDTQTDRKIQTDRQVDKKTDRQGDTQTDIRMDRHRQVDTQADRQT